MLRLSPQSISIVKASAPAFRVYGVEIARRTYERLSMDPKAATVFDMNCFADPDRSRWFADLMVETVEHIDDPEAFSHATLQMSLCHMDEGITSLHYIHLARAWPAAVRDVLGFGASDLMIEAWDETFWFLASLLVEKQDELQLAHTRLKAA